MSAAEFVEALRRLLGPAGLCEGDDMASHTQGARYGLGAALCVARPANAEEVSGVVRLCAQAGVQLVPQGANTGLVGASTPDASGRQIVLSLQRLRTVCAVDAANRSFTADAGVRLHEVNERLAAQGLCFPIDLGADPSIGGMVATNTGGTRLLRYGDVRRNLLAVQAVLLDPPGEIVHFGRALRKDNTGFDLKQLLAGTAGCGAVITRATFQAHPQVQQSATALVVPASDEAVIALLLALESAFGDFLSAYEGLSREAMQAAIAHVHGVRSPFGAGQAPEFAVLIELESSASPTYTGLDLQDALNRFLEDQFGALVADAVLGKGAELWALRHGVSEGARAWGRMIAFDVSVARGALMRFRREARALVAQRHPQVRVVDFGHVADGGLHFNLAWPDTGEGASDDAAVRRLRDDIYALVVEGFCGSFSAEHGIGPHNIDWYRRFTSPAELRLAGRIQALLDPRRLSGSVDYGAVA